MKPGDLVTILLSGQPHAEGVYLGINPHKPESSIAYAAFFDPHKGLTTVDLGGCSPWSVQGPL